MTTNNLTKPSQLQPDTAHPSKPQTAPQTATDIIIFGGGGDLAFRKLIPSLYTAHVHGELPPDLRITAVGRQPWTSEVYRTFIQQRSPEHINPKAMDAGQWQVFVQRLHYVVVDITVPASYGALHATLPATSFAAGDALPLDLPLPPKNASTVKVYYLATAPEFFAPICANLSLQGLITPQDRVVLEKPLGTDQPSARRINQDVAQYLQESQIFRIDHYLGKESVQNLLTLRFGNAIFEPLWRKEHISQVQITVAETEGVGTRAGFFDAAGSVRDMVQNHIMQILCLLTMEPPLSQDADAVRNEKLRVLHALRPVPIDAAQPEALDMHAVRGQYSAGQIAGSKVSGYLEEANVPKGSVCDTFAALQLFIDNPRWQGVPFYLRTGKRLPRREALIVVTFAPPLSAAPTANPLVIRIQPVESITWEVQVKQPGQGAQTQTAAMRLDLAQSAPLRRAEAYERLLLDVLHGRLTHFLRGDECEAAWGWIDPILQAWAADSRRPHDYPAGTWGPAASNALLAQNGHAWYPTDC